MQDASLDLGSLIAVVVVVMCSWGLSLIISYTCWRALNRSQPEHLYCVQCSTLQIGVPPSAPLFHPECMQDYSSMPHVYQNFNSEPLQNMVKQVGCLPTDERLGILENREVQSALMDHVHQSNDGNYYVASSKGYINSDVLETVPVPSPEDELDKDTTVSKSFLSCNKRSPLLFADSDYEDEGELKMTLNERFSKSLGVPHTSDFNKSKLSQVRVLVSPNPLREEVCSQNHSHSDIAIKENVTTIQYEGPINVKSKKSEKENSPVDDVEMESNARKKILPVKTRAVSSTETSDDEVFQRKNSSDLHNSLKLPSNDVSQVQNSSSKSVRQKRSIARRYSRKDRKIGSPGNTATAQFYLKQQQQLQSVEVDINLDKTAENQLDLRPQHGVAINAPSSSFNQLEPRSSTLGNSNFHNLSDKALVSNIANYQPTPTTMNLSSNVTIEALRSASNAAASYSLSTNTAPSVLSPDLSKMPYSSVSYTQSEMSLVVSSSSPGGNERAGQKYASSTSSKPQSLDWDHYESDPQFTYQGRFSS